MTNALTGLWDFARVCVCVCVSHVSPLFPFFESVFCSSARPEPLSSRDGDAEVPGPYTHLQARAAVTFERFLCTRLRASC